MKAIEDGERRRGGDIDELNLPRGGGREGPGRLLVRELAQLGWQLQEGGARIAGGRSRGQHLAHHAGWLAVARDKGVCV